MATNLPTALRLAPGDDLRGALEAWTVREGLSAAFVVAGIGSLVDPSIRFAAAPEATVLAGDWEITSLAGSLSPDGAHLHIVVSGTDGRVVGGHVSAGCRVRTTAEILVAPLPGLSFTRELDPSTGYRELSVLHK